MIARTPNILLVWTDQQRNDTLPCLGNSVVQAPNLQRLGETSFVFRHALCTQPVCTPSRASILTGLLPHCHGCVTNNIPLRPDVPTLAEMLPGNFDCAYYGKWHLGDELRAQRGFTDWRSIEDGIYREFYSDPEDLKLRSDYHHFLIREGFPPDATDAEGCKLFSRPYAAAMAEPYTKASYLAGEAETFLCSRHEQKNPFFLSVNFLEPHPPLFGPLNGLHDPEAVPTGAAFGRAVEDGSKHARRVLEKMRTTGFKNHPLATESDWRRLKANYLGLVSLVDRALGRILTTLEVSGQADNTIVVFTSDHGEMLGDHGLTQKGVFYEEATRVPLIIHVPWLTRATVMLDGPVSQVDLVPTLLDLADVPIPDHLQGVSRAGLLRHHADPGETDPWPGENVVVSWNNPTQPDEEGRSLVTTDGWKLNLYHDDQPELFHLDDDPSELTNLAGRAEHWDRVACLRDAIADWQDRFADDLPLNGLLR